MDVAETPATDRRDSALTLRRLDRVPQLGESTGKKPAACVEKCPFRLAYVEPHAVGEGKHRVGAHDDTEGVGDAIDVLLRGPPAKGLDDHGDEPLAAPLPDRRL